MFTPKRKHRSVDMDNSLEFLEGYEEVQWNHGKPVPQRSENQSCKKELYDL